MKFETGVGYSCELEMDDEFRGSSGDYLMRYFSGKILNLSSDFTHPPIRIETGERTSIGNTQELHHYNDHSVLCAVTGQKTRMLIDGLLSIEFDPDSGLFIALPKEELQNFFLRDYIARTVRSYVDKILLDAGFSFFHLGAVQFGDKTVLISGDKGAGKTTSMIIALEDFGAKYIANDRVWGKATEQGLIITEREGETKIGEDTIKNSPTLRNFNPLKDEKSGKYHYPQVYTLFGDGRRSISGISKYIFCPHILEDREFRTKKIEDPDNVLFSSYEELGLGFNQFRALFGEIPTPGERPKHTVIQQGIEGFGKKGIEEAFTIISK